MIKAAYRKFSKHLRVVLLLFVLATILTFFIPNDSPLWIRILVIFAFVLPIILIVSFISKIEAFRKLLDSLSLDEREEVEDALRSENSLGDIYVTRHFIVLHQCLHFNAITLAIIKRANIDSVELFHNTPPQSYQHVQIKTNDFKNVYCIEYPFFQISEKQLVNFIAGNSDCQETTLDAVNTKHKISTISITAMIFFGLIMTYVLGMWFITGYLPKTTPEFQTSDLYSLLVSGWTYLFMIPTALVTPIMYLRHKGDVENKFLWLLATCCGVFWAWFMWEMSTVF